MKNKTPITKNGHDKLTKELDYLIKVEREELKIKISEARELGDLKENAEYHSAKEKQALVEGRIAQIQGILDHAQIIDIDSIKSNRIVFGATVNLLDIEKDVKSTITIIGTSESDTSKGFISFNSPLGKALIGKEVGDEAIVHAPRGNIEYEILSFHFGKNKK